MNQRAQEEGFGGREEGVIRGVERGVYRGIERVEVELGVLVQR